MESNLNKKVPLILAMVAQDQAPSVLEASSL